jgi:hypothetical protein
MRTLAWLLGIVTVCGSVFLSIDGIIAHRGVQHASVAVSKAEDDLSEWQMSAELELKNHRAAIENDNLQLRNDDLNVQIAKLEGRSLAKANEQLYVDRMRLIADDSAQRLDELGNALGPDPQVSSAMERVQAAQRSLGVYRAAFARDERLAYAIGVFWLAFGFAVAFAQQRRGLDRHA